MRNVAIGLVILVLLAVSLPVAADYFVENSYVRVIMSMYGEFGIVTTGGRDGGGPDTSDDNKLLVYGSYNTSIALNVDSVNYVLEDTTPTVAPGVISSTALSATWEIDGVRVVAVYSIAEGGSGNPDVGLVNYDITNIGASSRTIGLKFGIDTKIGSNDSARLSTPTGILAVETGFGDGYDQPVPEYWQALEYSDLANPGVVAQGSFYGAGLTPPDTFVAGQYSAVMYGSYWDYVATGSSYGDSAVGMWWRDRLLLPGQTVTFATSYGLGSFSGSAGDVAIGVAAPSNVTSDSTNPFSVSVWLQNTTGTALSNLTVSLALGQQLTLAGDTTSTTQLVSSLGVGESKIVSWTVRAALGAVARQTQITASVLGANITTNSTTHNMTLEAGDDPSLYTPKLSAARFTPDGIRPDGEDSSTLTVYCSDPQGLSDIVSVVADLSALGMSDAQALYDHGDSGDVVANDGTYTLSGITVGNAVGVKQAAYYDVPITATDESQLTATTSARLYVGSDGSLQVVIGPAGALSGGAQWKVDGGAWQASGATVTGLRVGTHTLAFSDVSNFIKPSLSSAVITSGQAKVVNATYTVPPSTGSLRVTLSPQAAVNAGAQWRIGSGTWRNSATTVSDLDPGAYSINYKDVAGYVTPAATTATVVAGQTTSVSAAYALGTGTVVIDVTPDTGQWSLRDALGNVEMGTGDATLTDVTAGTVTVAWRELDGYLTPPRATVSQTLTVNGTVTFSEVYLADSDADSDGDGLADAVETDTGEYVSRTDTGTDPNNDDTDGDGMPDGYEVWYGLDPNDATDANLDLDEDGLSNLREYIEFSDPRDPNDPFATRYVSTSGNDESGDGSASAPWRTISKALSSVSASQSNPYTIVVLAGTYVEDLTLRPYVTVQGAARTTVILQGSVTGATNAAIKTMTIKAGDSPLLSMANVAMQVVDVTFDGQGTTGYTGIEVTGNAPAESLIDQCSFKNLYYGIEVYGAIPLIRRTRLEDIAQDGIILYPLAAKAEGDNALGEVDDLNSGYNAFIDIGQYAINNQRDEEVKAQNCYYQNASVSSNVDKSSSLSSDLQPGSVIVTVWDAETQKRVSSSSVSLDQNTADTAQKSMGVYLFSVVPAGRHSLRVETAGYKTESTSLSVVGGEQQIMSFALEVGSGSNNDNNGCAAVPGEHHSGFAADMVVLAASLLVLVVASRRRRADRT